MALTSITNERRFSLGSVRGTSATVNFGANYPTGGEPLDPGSVGLTSVYWVSPAFDKGTGTEFVSPDTTDPKNPLLEVYTADGSEASNDSDQSGVTVDLLIVGV